MLHAAGVVFKGREAAEKGAESGGDKPGDRRRKSHANCAMSITYDKWHKNQKKVNFPLALLRKVVYNNKRALKARHHPPVAKLDIAVDSDSKGRGFESLRAGQLKKPRKPHG